MTGYDLTSLFTGSEGTLGVVTQALFRLIPMPKRRGTLQAMFRTLDDGCRTIHTMLQSGVVPAAAEIMDRTCLEVVARHRKTDLDPEAGACIVIEIDGDDDAALEAQAEPYREGGKGVRRHDLPHGPVTAGVGRHLGRPAGDQLRRGRPRAQPHRRRHLGSPRRLPGGGAPHPGDLREARVHRSPFTATPATATSTPPSSAT